MINFVLRLASLATVTWLATLAGSGVAVARPYQTEDLLALQTVGPAIVDPSQRWLVLSTTRPWSEAPRYDLDYATFEALGALQIVDLTAPGRPRPLLPIEKGVGYVAGPFSPLGDRMLVFRVEKHRREVGVVTVATGEVQWLGLVVEAAPWGRSVQWLSEDVFLAVSRSPGAHSRGFGYGWQVQALLQTAWAKAAGGDLAVTALGAGRYEALNPRGEDMTLLSVTVSTGQTRPLLRGDIADIEVAPGEKTVAVVINDEAIAVRPDETVTPSTPWRRRRLRLLDMPSGEVLDPLPGLDLLSASLAWSATGKDLLVFARPDGADWATGALREVSASGVALDLGEGAVAATLATARDGQVSIRAGFVGDQVVIFGEPSQTARGTVPTGPAADGRATWRRLDGAPLGVGASATMEASDRTGSVFSDLDGLFRVEAGQEPRRLAKAGAAIVRPGRAAVGVRPEVTPMVAGGLCCARLTGRTLWLGPSRRPVTTGPDESVIGYAPARGVAIVERRDKSGVSTVGLRGRNGFQPLLTVNGHLAAVDVPLVQPVRHPGPGGRLLTSWLYRPADVPADARLPLIIVPYPGANYAAEPAMAQPQFPQFSASVQMMLGQGYAVLVPSLPLATDAEPGVGLASTILDIADRAAADGGIDRSRIAVWGQSFGGYAALMAATQSDRFFAVIASAPVSDLASFWGAIPPQVSLIPGPGLAVAALTGWAENGQGRMQGPPWRDPERWRRNSPLWLADRVKAPVMLIQGDIDADPTQTAMMFQALARQNKDVIWLNYHGEGHVVIGRDNVRDLYSRAFRFLDDASGISRGDASTKGGDGLAATAVSEELGIRPSRDAGMRTLEVPPERPPTENRGS